MKRSGMPTNPELLAARTRRCLHCRTEFVAKKSQLDAGHGKYCSHRCASDGGAHAKLLSPEIKSLAIERRAASIAVNGTAHKRGAEHHSWKGGRDAWRERSRERNRLYLRRRRAADPERARELVRKRRRGITSSLPRGTIKRLGELQRWLCVVCRCDIRERYHVDHITPLARGGQHVPRNLQLLCPTCNTRKSAKDPIAFMQERGFLL